MVDSKIRVGIITISDRSARGEREDLSGPILHEKIVQIGWQVVQLEIIPDEVDLIASTLRAWCDAGRFDLVLTTGGTGVAPRDVTPEATQMVVEKLVPGLVEAARAESIRITPHAMLSRGIAGIRGQTLIINLPGSPKGAIENLSFMLQALPHAVQLLREDPRSEKGH